MTEAKKQKVTDPVTSDTVTITLSREDAAYMAEDTWIEDRLGRIGRACHAALGDKDANL